MKRAATVLLLFTSCASAYALDYSAHVSKVEAARSELLAASTAFSDTLKRYIISNKGQTQLLTDVLGFGPSITNSAYTLHSNLGALNGAMKIASMVTTLDKESKAMSEMIGICDSLNLDRDGFEMNTSNMALNIHVVPKSAAKVLGPATEKVIRVYKKTYSVGQEVCQSF